MAQALDPELSGDRKTCTGPAGRLVYYVRGTGRPLLLLHSINAAASAYEMKPIYEQWGGRAFAPDLPGFGFSERSRRDYSPQLYTAAIGQMLDQIEQECGLPADAVALSLSGEFLARAALRWPTRLRRLVLITPTGFQRGADSLRKQEGSTRQFSGVLPVIGFPLLSDGLFAALSTQRSIRYFLRRTWGAPDIDDGLAAYAYRTSHQPGAKHAPLAFLSGKLFSADIRTVYEKLTNPIWMPHAMRGDFADFSEAEWLKQRPNWRREPFPTGALVHYEQPEVFMARLRDFLSEDAKSPHVDPGTLGHAARSSST